MKRLTVLLIAAASLVLALSAQAEKVPRLDRFRLWNNCQPMQLVVESLDQDAADIGLTREAIATAVRSRLRGARLYGDTGPQYLYVNVNVVGQAWALKLEYNKTVFDLASGESFPATTWKTGAAGTHGRDSGYILSWMSQHTDKFIDNYLRVNEDACQK